MLIYVLIRNKNFSLFLFSQDRVYNCRVMKESFDSELRPASRAERAVAGFEPHKPDEYIDIADVEKAVEYYKNIILKFLTCSISSS